MRALGLPFSSGAVKRKFKFSFPYEPRAHKPTPGRAHTLPTSAGLSCSSFRMVSGELPGVRGGKGSPRVDYVDRYPSRGHFSSQNKFRVRVPKSKPEAVAPSPKPPPRGRNRPDAGLAKKKSARNSASRSEREIKPRLACYCSKL